MKKVLSVIDSVSVYTAEVMKWFCYALVLIVVFEVIMRYVFNDPTIWGYETAIMVGGTIYVMAWSYTHSRHRHVRVDIVYAHLSLRAKAGVDAIGTLFFLLPLMIILTYTSGKWALRAWEINEKSIETYWYPPFAPFRTIILIGFCLFTLQTIVQLIRDFHFVIRNKPL